MMLIFFLKTGDADTKMNTLDDNMMKTCKILTGIDEDKAKSLRTFIACKPLVVWLRETMPCKFVVYCGFIVIYGIPIFVEFVDEGDPKVK